LNSLSKYDLIKRKSAPPDMAKNLQGLLEAAKKLIDKNKELE
jgi:hypothetical protein